jgi:hypothetical protein
MQLAGFSDSAVVGADSAAVATVAMVSAEE